MTAHDYGTFPAELKALPHWVCAKPDKIPKNPKTGWNASVTDPTTWGTYEEVVKAGFPHIGFVFKKGDPYVAIDMDPPCNDEERVNHDHIYNTVVSYTERSMSGEGVHIIAHGSIPHAVKRDHVEIYDRERYFIMTGDHIEGRPTTIEDCNDVINGIVEQADSERSVAIEHSEPEKETDRAVYDKCLSYANGDRFNELWEGRWQGNPKYPSQSEADLALINHLAFVSHNNDQTVRMFRTSALGQRKKADRDDYLAGMIGQIRAEQNPQIDFSKFKAPAIAKEPEHIKSDIVFPGGLVGEMAQYILDTAVKPIPGIALAGAMGLMCGLTGRTYNISNTGLNLYLLCLAGTGVGKEGAVQGMERIMDAVARKLPASEQFIGPEEFASGQALVKALEGKPCMVAPLGEFGHTLRKICHPNAIGADLMFRKLLLQLYNKSGPTDKLRELVYSDTGKNTAKVLSPAFSIVAESTASSVFENLSEAQIEMGLIPRFFLIDCPDKRPYTNPNHGISPSTELTAKVEALALRCLSMGANNTRQPITIDPGAQRMLTAFDREIDDKINAQNDDVTKQIWTRSYMKALRLSGIVAVGNNPDTPNVTEREAQWALDFTRIDALSMSRRFGDGVGGGDPEQVARLRNVITNVLHGNQCSRKMKEHGVVSHQIIAQRIYKLACFKSDRIGAGHALNRALQALTDGGEIINLSAKDTQEKFDTYAKCYWVTKSFQSR